MFDAVCFAPAVQLDLVLFEALRMQNLGFNVCIEVVVLKIPDPYGGIVVRCYGVHVLPTSRVVERQGPNAGWFSQLGLQVDCRRVRGYKEVFWEGDNGLIVVRVGGIVWMPRESVSSV